MLFQPTENFSKCECAGKCADGCKCAIQQPRNAADAKREIREVVGNNPVTQELLLS